MILVGDVGGTRTRLALAAKADDGWRITGVEERRTAPDILAAVADFVRTAGPVKAAAFSGAGAVSADGSIRLTNADVRLEPAALARAAGVAAGRGRERFRRHRDGAFRTCRPSRSPPAGAAHPLPACRSPCSGRAPGSAPRSGRRPRAVGSPSPVTAAMRTLRRSTTRSSRSGSGCAVRTAACRRNRC